MEYPRPQQIIISFILIAGLYLGLASMWRSVRTPYSRLITSVVTRVGFPLLALEGSVRADTERWIVLTYTVSDRRTNGWGRVKQRFLDFSDLPLAAAAGFGFLYLGWRRRMIVASGAIVILSLCHMALILWSAHRFYTLLGRTGLAAEDIEEMIESTATQATGFGNISTVVTLATVGILTIAVKPGLSPKPRSTE